MPRTKTAPPTDALERLRRAVRNSGLVAELGGLDEVRQGLVVSNRLVQTTLRYLADVDPPTGEALAAELRGLGPPEACQLLLHDRCYTFLPLVQFLYEYVREHGALADRRFFAAGVGRGGGGLEVAPDREVSSLVGLMTTALPAMAGGRTLGGMMQMLGPLFLARLFPAGFLAMEMEPGPQHLSIELRFRDAAAVRASLSTCGLSEEAGRLFFNTALHVQGLLELGWRTLLAGEAGEVGMEGLIESLSPAAQEQIEKEGRCTWVARWQGSLSLRQLPDEEAVLAHTRVICEALQQKDVQYLQERIKGLELRLQAIEEQDQYHELIGRSEPMLQLYRQIEQVAGTDLTVLLRGESGTGKELVARAVHHSSPRRQGPFVAVNCAALAENLLESELFGHEKGAFTGALQARPGRFELADGGTLFLDEIGDLPPATQVKLLRVLETQTFERVGGTRTIRTNVRLIGATNRDLEELVRGGQLREDFYFRIQVLPIYLPALRQHREDIPHLAQHFLRRLGQRSGRQFEGFTRGAIQRLVNHPWPGNIRELRHTIERAAVLYGEGPVLGEQQVSRALGGPARAPAPTEPPVAPAAGPLNRRQEEVLRRVAAAGRDLVVEELLAALPAGRGGGRSARTLQNDLGKLSAAGLLSWIKEGNARAYRLTSAGREYLVT